MADPSEKKLLLIDDSSTMRRILSNTLKRCGYTDVTTASDGPEALDKCKEQHFDCILTDWNMPEMDGLEITRKLREDEHYAKVPIVMITTEARRDDVIEAFKTGVTSYIVKPFTPEVFKKKIDEFFVTYHEGHEEHEE